MNCPSCHSDQTQRLQVIYEGGRQNISVTSTSYGGTSGASGPVNTYSSGTSTTQLAQKCAPPAKKDWSIGMVIAVIGGMMFLFAHDGTWRAFGVGGIALGVYLYKAASTYNTLVLPPLMEKWMKEWHCNKCGSIYTA